jgi:hypothetical protein
VNESGAISLLVDPLEIDDKFVGSVFGECEYFSTKERDDVIGYYRYGFVLEVSVVDPEVRVEPVDLVRDQLARNEALGPDISLDLCALLFLAFEDGSCITWKILDALKRDLAAGLGIRE